MLSTVDLVFLTALSLATIGLLAQQRRMIRRAEAVWPVQRRGASPKQWFSMAACVTVAAVMCGLAARLAARSAPSIAHVPAVVLAVDVSRSMYAEDIEPDRLARARRVLVQMLDHMAGWRVGVVAFAGGAFVVCPPMVDRAAVRSALQALNEGAAPSAGTSIGAGIDEALRSLAERDDHRAAILLVTDGENLEGTMDDTLAVASSRGVPVHVLAVGTPQGARVPARPGAASNRRTVTSRIDEAFLQSVARRTGGQYAAISSDADVDAARFIDSWRLSDGASSRRAAVPRETLYRYVAAVALALLGTATFLTQWP